VAVVSAGPYPYANLHLAQTDNHARIPPLSFLLARCPSCRPTNSVKTLKAHMHEGRNDQNVQNDKNYCMALNSHRKDGEKTGSEGVVLRQVITGTNWKPSRDGQRYVTCDLELRSIKNSFCAFTDRVKTYTHTKN